ncbi:MAG: FAD-dependent oxidoreductase [Phycisphaeraceae bacterium]
MPDVIIIGDGPGGLTAALFLAKKQLEVVVFGQDKTPMHKALLLNYPGIRRITGSQFQQTLREQVESFGGKIRDAAVTAVARDGASFTATTEAGDRLQARYLIFAAGHGATFAEGVGVTLDDRKMIPADRDGRTSVDNVYAVGWSTRADKIQAVISAGDGAAAALDILSREAGKEVHDFDLIE